MVRATRREPASRALPHAIALIRAIVTLACLAAVAVAAASPHPRASDGPWASGASLAADSVAPAPRDASGSARRPARGKLLVAGRRLADPNFAGAVILVLEYGPGGAVGIIVNRSTELVVADVVLDVPELAGRTEHLYFGGPVEPERVLLLVRSSQAPENSLELAKEVFVTGSLNALKQLIRERKDKAEFRLVAGYAGWGAGQLDAEIQRGDWLIGDADAGAVFSTDPEGIWKRLIDRLAGQWTRAGD